MVLRWRLVCHPWGKLSVPPANFIFTSNFLHFPPHVFIQTHIISKHELNNTRGMTCPFGKYVTFARCCEQHSIYFGMLTVFQWYTKKHPYGLQVKDGYRQGPDTQRLAFLVPMHHSFPSETFQKHHGYWQISWHMLYHESHFCYGQNSGSSGLQLHFLLFSYNFIFILSMIWKFHSIPGEVGMACPCQAPKCLLRRILIPTALHRVP